MEIEDVQNTHSQQSLQPIPGLLTHQKKVLDPLFEDFELIGTGSSGNVFRCKHRLTKQVVAVKIITIPENEKTNGFVLSIILGLEVAALKELNHANVVRLLMVLEDKDNLYLVFEHLDYNLHKFLANPWIFKYPRLTKNFLHQILSGVAHIHSHGSLHRNLKPQNVLVHCRTRVVRLADFGLPKTFEVPLSSYSSDVVSPCYRAPELLFGSTKYSTATDIWSVGCIFAEMVTGRPLFSGKHVSKILVEIFRLLGSPTEETWPGLSSVRNFLKELNRPIKPKDLAVEFPSLEPAGVDLLSKLLCLCPKYRISAEDAVNHPYFDRM